MDKEKLKKPGRPKKPNMVTMSFKVDKQLADFIRSQPDKYSVTIEKALRIYFQNAHSNNSQEPKEQPCKRLRYF